jgi:peptide deformylase
MTHYPAEVLAGRAKPIEKIDESIHRLVDKMTDIMVENKGIGLAGLQAGVDLRIFIISLDGSREAVRAYINPTVTTKGDNLLKIEEGCLSVPGVYTKIRRYARCSVTATGLDGKTFTEDADGLYARALQHEYDHIEGLTIVNRMGQTAKIVHRKQLRKLSENK